MRIRMLAMIAIAFALGAAAPPRPAPIEELDIALHELNPGSGAFTLATIPPTERGAFARARADRIEVDPDALALIEDRQSARALAALLLSYYAMPEPDRVTTSPSRAGTMAAAAGAILLGTRVIDPADRKAWRQDDPRPAVQLGWFPPQREGPEDGAIRASRMIALLNRAGGCSGPLSDMLENAEKLGNREAASLARQVRRDLGRSVYPPDYSCI